VACCDAGGPAQCESRHRHGSSPPWTSHAHGPCRAAPAASSSGSPLPAPGQPPPRDPADEPTAPWTANARCGDPLPETHGPPVTHRRHRGHPRREDHSDLSAHLPHPRRPHPTRRPARDGRWIERTTIAATVTDRSGLERHCAPRHRSINRYGLPLRRSRTSFPSSRSMDRAHPGTERSCLLPARMQGSPSLIDSGLVQSPPRGDRARSKRGRLKADRERRLRRRSAEKAIGGGSSDGTRPLQDSVRPCALCACTRSTLTAP